MAIRRDPGDGKRVWRPVAPEEREATTIVDTIAVVTALIAAVASIAALGTFGPG
jgi:hypothetical protein